MPSEWRITRIEPEDRAEVRSFARSATWLYTHCDYTREEVLSRPGYQAHDRAGRRIGVMGCGMDEPPVARILIVAIGRRVPPRTVVPALLESHARDMRAQGATQLAFLGWAPWLAHSLEALGFETRTTVVTYSRRRDAVLEQGNRDVLVRPAVAADVDVLVELDRVAFEPLWRYSAEIHRRLLGSATHCTIAELAGVPIGYQIGDISGEQGHIIRLAVHREWQGRGVGMRLLADVIEFFQIRRVQRIMVNTQADNAASRRLYERTGFVRWTEEVPVMIKELAAEPAAAPLQPYEVNP